MPSFRHHEPGELYVKISVKFPETIDPAVIPMLENALPPRKDLAKLGKKKHIDEVMLEEPNDRQRRSAATNGDEMDEDEEEGRPGVQCAQREWPIVQIESFESLVSQNNLNNPFPPRLHRCSFASLHAYRVYPVHTLLRHPTYLEEIRRQHSWLRCRVCNISESLEHVTCSVKGLWTLSCLVSI